MIQGSQSLGPSAREGFASLLQHGAIGHFLGQRMLKEVLDFGKRGLLVQKLFVWSEASSRYSTLPVA